jgi:hypothetical protein
MIGQLFVQIYPNSACAPMHAHFAESYRASATAFGDVREAVAMRKPAAMTAVA